MAMDQNEDIFAGLEHILPPLPSYLNEELSPSQPSIQEKPSVQESFEEAELKKQIKMALISDNRAKYKRYGWSKDNKRIYYSKPNKQFKKQKKFFIPCIYITCGHITQTNALKDIGFLLRNHILNMHSTVSISNAFIEEHIVQYITK